MDGSLNGRGVRVGIVLTTTEGSIIEQSYTSKFCATNNEAEYEAIIAGLMMAATIGIKEFEVHCYSLHIVSQINGEYTAKDERMAYLKIITTWKFKFSCCKFIQVPRSENSHANSQAMLVSAVDFQFRREILIEYILKLSIYKSDEEVLRLDTSLGSRDPIVAYLKEGTLPGDKIKAQKLQHLATRYILLGDLLTKSLIPKCTLNHT